MNPAGATLDPNLHFSSGISIYIIPCLEGGAKDPNTIRACNSGKEKVSSLLKESIKDLELAYKASKSVPADQVLSDEQGRLKSTLDICKEEEASSDWYKEAMSGEVSAVKNPQHQKVLINPDFLEFLPKQAGYVLSRPLLRLVHCSSLQKTM